MKTVKISSPNGFADGTKITDVTTGEEIRGITRVDLSIRYNELNKAILYMDGSILEVQAEAEVEMEWPERYLHLLQTPIKIGQKRYQLVEVK